MNKSYPYTEKYKLISDKAVIRLSDGAIAQHGEKVLTYDNDTHEIACIEVSWDGSDCILITILGEKIQFDKIFVFKEFKTVSIPLDGYRISGRQGNGSIHSVVRESDDSLICVGDVGIIENASKNIFFGDLYKIEYFLISNQKVLGVDKNRIGNFGIRTFKKSPAVSKPAGGNDLFKASLTSEVIDSHFEKAREATTKQPEPESGREKLSKRSRIREDIEQVLNKYSLENGSATPDFILAEYLINCLRMFDKAVNNREEWYSNSVSKQES